MRGEWRTKIRDGGQLKLAHLDQVGAIVAVITHAVHERLQVGERLHVVLRHHVPGLAQALHAAVVEPAEHADDRVEVADVLQGLGQLDEQHDGLGAALRGLGVAQNARGDPVAQLFERVVRTEQRETVVCACVCACVCVCVCVCVCE